MATKGQSAHWQDRIQTQSNRPAQTSFQLRCKFGFFFLDASFCNKPSFRSGEEVGCPGPPAPQREEVGAEAIAGTGKERPTGSCWDAAPTSRARGSPARPPTPHLGLLPRHLAAPPPLNPAAFGATATAGPQQMCPGPPPSAPPCRLGNPASQARAYPSAFSRPLGGRAHPAATSQSQTEREASREVGEVGPPMRNRLRREGSTAPTPPTSISSIPSPDRLLVTAACCSGVCWAGPWRLGWI